MDKFEQSEQAMAEIMNMFRYHYMNDWAPENIFSNKSRIWIQAFNDLVKNGYIKRKKSIPGYKYKWTGVWPEGF